MKQQGPGNGTEGGRNPIHKQTRLFTTVQLGEEIISYKHIQDIFDYILKYFCLPCLNCF